MLPRERAALAQQREIERLRLLINTGTVSSFLASSVLFGGTVGQVLTKLSSTDLDVSWQPEGAGAWMSGGTTVISTSGTTQTIPKASADLLGSSVTYILTVPGYADIATQGGDTIQVDGSQTVIRLDQEGASVTLRCLSTSTWGIV